MVLGYLQYTISLGIYEGYHGEVFGIPIVAQSDAMLAGCGRACNQSDILTPNAIDCSAVYMVVLILNIKRTAILLYGSDVALGNP